MTTSTYKPAVPAQTGRRQPPRSSAGRSPGTVAFLMLVPGRRADPHLPVVPIVLTFVLAFTNARLISPNQPGSSASTTSSASSTATLLGVAAQHLDLRRRHRARCSRRSRLRLAMLVNVKMRGVNFFRTIYFLPVVTSIVVVSILWLFMYQPDGLINALLRQRSGIQGTDWLSNPNTALFAIIVLVDLAGRRLPHGDLAVRSADHSR